MDTITAIDRREGLNTTTGVSALPFDEKGADIMLCISWIVNMSLKCFSANDARPAKESALPRWPMQTHHYPKRLHKEKRKVNDGT